MPANALPAVLSEALLYTRPGVLELLPAVPDQLAKGTITGVRGRNQVRIDSLAWDLPGRTATVTLTSAVTQAITLISRRGIASVTTSAPVTSSPLGPHARVISLTAGQQVQVTVGLPTGTRRTTPAGQPAQRKGAGRQRRLHRRRRDHHPVAVDRRRPTSNGRCCRTATAHTGCPASGAERSWTAPGGSGQGAALIQWADTRQHEPVVEPGPRGDQRLLPARQREQRMVCRHRRRLHRRRRQGRPAPVSGEASQEWQIIGVSEGSAAVGWPHGR